MCVRCPILVALGGSKVSTATLKLVFAADNTSDGIPVTINQTLCNTSQSFSSKPLYLGALVSLVNFLLDDVSGQQVGSSFHRQGTTSFGPSTCIMASFWHALFCLCSTSGLNSELLILLYVVTPASQNPADKRPVNHDLCSQFHLRWQSVTPFLSQMALMSWFLFFYCILTARLPLPGLLLWCFLSLRIGTLGKLWSGEG